MENAWKTPWKKPLRRLLSYGASPESKAQNGASALSLATRNSDQAMLSGSELDFGKDLPFTLISHIRHIFYTFYPKFPTECSTKFYKSVREFKGYVQWLALHRDLSQGPIRKSSWRPPARLFQGCRVFRMPDGRGPRGSGQVVRGRLKGKRFASVCDSSLPRWVSAQSKRASNSSSRSSRSRWCAAWLWDLRMLEIEATRVATC